MNRETAALITAAKIRLYKKLYPDMEIDSEYEGKIFEESLRNAQIEEEMLNARNASTCKVRGSGKPA